MKTIKFIAAAVMCLLSLTANAQSMMRIELEGGKQVDYPVSTITSIKWFTNETTPTTPDVAPSGVQAVDLGLSVKWANMNIGANSMEDYGDYFAWGETSPKSTYKWSTYKWCNGSYTTMTKYCSDSSDGNVDNKTTLEPADDAAIANWGGSWRMPTKAEQDELRTKCIWVWTSLNGKKGYKVTGPSWNSIFLPAAGYREDDDSIYGSSLHDAGSYGRYWSSSLSTFYSNCAFYLGIDLEGVDFRNVYRYYGCSVRAVCP